jgi:hypothetical protein
MLKTCMRLQVEFGHDRTVPAPTATGIAIHLRLNALNSWFTNHRPQWVTLALNVLIVSAGLLIYPASAFAQQAAPATLVGSYERLPVENDWHAGKIEVKPDGSLAWTNNAGVSWKLILDAKSNVLNTAEDCPYPGAVHKLQFGKVPMQRLVGRGGDLLGLGGSWLQNKRESSKPTDPATLVSITPSVGKVVMTDSESNNWTFVRKDPRRPNKYFLSEKTKAGQVIPVTEGDVDFIDFANHDDAQLLIEGQHYRLKHIVEVKSFILNDEIYARKEQPVAKEQPVTPPQKGVGFSMAQVSLPGDEAATTIGRFSYGTDRRWRFLSEINQTELEALNLESARKMKTLHYRVLEGDSKSGFVVLQPDPTIGGSHQEFLETGGDRDGKLRIDTTKGVTIPASGKSVFLVNAFDVRSPMQASVDPNSVDLALYHSRQSRHYGAFYRYDDDKWMLVSGKSLVAIFEVTSKDEFSIYMNRVGGPNDKISSAQIDLYQMEIRLDGKTIAGIGRAVRDIRLPTWDSLLPPPPVVPLISDGREFLLLETARGEYVSAGSNDNVLRWARSDGGGQRWTLESASGGKYRIKNQRNSRYMTVYPGAGGNVTVENKGTNAKGQIFAFEEVNADTVREKVKSQIYEPYLDVAETYEQAGLSPPFAFVRIRENTRNEYVGTAWNGNVLRWQESNDDSQIYIMVSLESNNDAVDKEAIKLAGVAMNTTLNAYYKGYFTGSLGTSAPFNSSTFRSYEDFLGSESFALLDEEGQKGSAVKDWDFSGNFYREFSDNRISFSVVQDKKHVYVTFLGTVNDTLKEVNGLPNWNKPWVITNAQPVLHSRNFEGVWTHPGWAALSNTVYQTIVGEIERLDPNNQKSVILSGHSLGGAVAGHVMYRLLAKKQLNIALPHRLVTFGAPRYAPLSFKAHYEAHQRQYPNAQSYTVEVAEDGIWYSWRAAIGGVVGGSGAATAVAPPAAATIAILYATAIPAENGTLVHKSLDTLSAPNRGNQHAHFNYYLLSQEL